MKWLKFDYRRVVEASLLLSGESLSVVIWWKLVCHIIVEALLSSGGGSSTVIK